MLQYEVFTIVYSCVCFAHTVLYTEKGTAKLSSPSYPEREWFPSWNMCGLYWAKMVTVSHCCPITSRACCSLALRRLIPLNWKQKGFIRGRKKKKDKSWICSKVANVPREVDLRTLIELDEQCYLLSLWTQTLRHSLHSQWRYQAVLLPSVPSHFVAPPGMAFRRKKEHLCVLTSYRKVASMQL